MTFAQRTERGDIFVEAGRWYAETEDDMLGPYDTREEALDALYPEDDERLNPQDYYL